MRGEPVAVRGRRLGVAITRPPPASSVIIRMSHCCPPPRLHHAILAEIETSPGRLMCRPSFGARRAQKGPSLQRGGTSPPPCLISSSCALHGIEILLVRNGRAGALAPRRERTNGLENVARALAHGEQGGLLLASDENDSTTRVTRTELSGALEATTKLKILLICLHSRAVRVLVRLCENNNHHQGAISCQQQQSTRAIERVSHDH